MGVEPALDQPIRWNCEAFSGTMNGYLDSLVELVGACGSVPVGELGCLSGKTIWQEDNLALRLPGKGESVRRPSW
jgi:hypothetical protein